MSQSTTAYLTEKCEVRNRDVAGGKAVYARELIEPGELIAVWSGRIIGADALSGRVLLRFPHGEYVPVSGNGRRLLLHGYSRLYAVDPKRRAR